MKHPFTILCCLALFLNVQAFSALAQSGDRKGHVMAEVWKDMDVPPAPALSPEEAIKTIRVAPGFRVELAAADPLVEDPVAMSWDGDGNLYVVEMRGYMPDVNGSGETTLSNGVVAVLQDLDHDGRMDNRIEFLNGLVMPRAVSVVKGGVLVAEPPILWYCQDTNGDFICDKKTKVADYGKQGPVEHTENALMPALDNWMYNAKSSRRFKFLKGKIIEEGTKGRGQWGMAQDNYGRLFYTSNSSYWQADWDMYFNAGINNMRGYLGSAGPEIHSIRVNPGINRGYQDNMLKEDGRLARVTAVSGLAHYRGGLYPEPYNHSVLIAEPAANAVACFTLTEENNRLQVKHELYDDETWGKREFIASTDERFRPVSIYNGPDGCLYIVDLYRGILQHKVYVTTFLRKQILERGLDKPLGLGRIYRVVPDGVTPDYGSSDLNKANGAVLAGKLSDANGWVRDTAQRLLVERSSQDDVPHVEKMLLHSDHLARVHALWALQGMNALNADHCLQAMKDSHPRVRLTALTVSDSLRSKMSAKKSLRAGYEELSSDSDELVQSLAKEMINRMDGKSQQTVEVKVKAPRLKGEHKKLYEQGKELYSTTCFGCHQADGKGLENVAPNLAGSDWVKGPVDRIIKVALDGLTGPIKVNGQEVATYPVMPGHRGVYNDQQLAAVLTYVRAEWGNNSGLVKAEEVKAVRDATADREVPYTHDELSIR
jgi:mono/diheme cytochrome c family protein/glucose/arabinose dehydrogenase